MVKRKISIKAILERYGEKAAVAARQALRDNAATLVEEAKRRCPVEKGFYKGRQYKLKHRGRLRDSIHVENAGKDTIAVVADAKDDKGYPYAPIVEYSSKNTINLNGMIINPLAFMKPAYEAKKVEMVNHSKDTIRAAIRK